MTSNNLEAIELIKNRILDSGVLREHDRKSSTTPREYNQILTADALAQYIAPLLQADEDIEVKEHACLCKEDNCPNCELIGCKHKKPTKETKLEAIKERLQLMDSPRPEVLYLRDEVIRITNILAKEEY